MTKPDIHEMRAGVALVIIGAERDQLLKQNAKLAAALTDMLGAIENQRTSYNYTHRAIKRLGIDARSMAAELDQNVEADCEAARAAIAACEVKP